MFVRKVKKEEFETACEIYNAGREIMRKSGNMEQWSGGYPYPEITARDIEEEILWGVEEEGELCGVFAFLEKPDPDYEKLVEGAWLNDKPYRAIHRVASSGKYHGVLRVILDFCKGYEIDLKIDTHRDNKIMQHLLEKNGFKHCGTALLLPDKIRLAYHYTKGE